MCLYPLCSLGSKTLLSLVAGERRKLHPSATKESSLNWLPVRLSPPFWSSFQIQVQSMSVTFSFRSRGNSLAQLLVGRISFSIRQAQGLDSSGLGVTPVSPHPKGPKLGQRVVGQKKCILHKISVVRYFVPENQGVKDFT